MDIEATMQLIASQPRNLVPNDITTILAKPTTKGIVAPALSIAGISDRELRKDAKGVMDGLARRGLRVDAVYPRSMPREVRTSVTLDHIDTLREEQFLVIPYDADVCLEEPWRFAKKLTGLRMKSLDALDPLGKKWSLNLLPFGHLKDVQKYLTLADTIVCFLYDGNQLNRSHSVQIVDLIRASAIDALLDSEYIHLSQRYCGRGDGRGERHSLDASRVPSLSNRPDYDLAVHFLPFMGKRHSRDTVIRARNFTAEHYCGKSGNINMVADRETLTIDPFDGKPAYSRSTSGAENACFHKIAVYHKIRRVRPDGLTLPNLFPSPSDEMMKLYLKARHRALKERQDEDGKVHLVPLGVFDIERLLHASYGRRNDLCASKDLDPDDHAGILYAAGPGPSTRQTRTKVLDAWANELFELNKAAGNYSRFTK
ncbi:hypothetical protein HY641_00565 [Candidatus Woesearchaeota archaeon]|nr:hypothetical protein [Candidatus Woesearchaeota archaeon]